MSRAPKFDGWPPPNTDPTIWHVENMIEYFSLDQSLGLRIFKNHMKREHHHVLLVIHSNACLSLLVPGENLKLTSL